MSRGMEPVHRIDLQASSRTSYLHTKMRLPEHVVSDLPALLKAAQALNPAIDPEALVRTIFRLGMRAVRRNNERGVPIRLADLPYARVAADEQEAAAHQPPACPVPDGLRLPR